MSIVSTLREVAGVLGSEDVRRSIETVGRGVHVAKSALDVIERGAHLGRDVLRDFGSVRRDSKSETPSGNAAPSGATTGAGTSDGAERAAQDSASGQGAASKSTARMSQPERETLALKQEESRLRMQFAIHQMNMKLGDQLVTFNQDRMDAKRRAMMGSRR